eukprot:904697_1
MERRQEGKENNADGSFPSSHMISLFNSLDAVHRDFTTKFAFHTLGRDKEEHCTLDSILNTINDKIVQIIDAIADGSLGFDVAFTQISASVTYATLLLSNLDPQQIVNYHEQEKPVRGREQMFLYVSCLPCGIGEIKILQ